MQSTIYNFYCLNTLAKNFFRLNPTLTYANYKVSLNSDINVSCISNIIPNKLIVFDTDVKFKNKQFIETVMYYHQPDKDHISIKYNIDIFNNLNLDTSLKLDRFFDKEKTPKMNPYFWCNLSDENQKELNNIYEILNVMEEVKLNKDFKICK